MNMRRLPGLLPKPVTSVDACAAPVAHSARVNAITAGCQDAGRVLLRRTDMRSTLQAGSDSGVAAVGRRAQVGAIVRCGTLRCSKPMRESVESRIGGP
ncbi:hypothetical protein [Lysobacter capsici]|uniref:hypothetical protein n=1 Tax=Lysobacter capsici TaxID=435897 RepID=UPI00136565F0|nr:hypothetical protein [Lysobacter capsici]